VWPTKILHVVLVSIATSNTVTRSLGLGCFRLNSYKPAITFGMGGSLKGVFVAVKPKREVVVAFLGHIRCFTLQAEG